MKKVHISIVGGEWYARAPNNSHEARCALVPAITFCDRLNDKQGRGATAKQRRNGRRWSINQEKRS